MILGDPTKLQSQFRLTYNMILNLLRVEALKIEEMIKRSFSENTTQTMMPEHERQVALSEEGLKKLKKEDCEICSVDLEACHSACIRLKVLSGDVLLRSLATTHGRRLFTPGRLIAIQEEVGFPSPQLHLGDVIFTKFL
jgi:antiviral helicase SKI2